MRFFSSLILESNHPTLSIYPIYLLLLLLDQRNKELQQFIAPLSNLTLNWLP